MRSKKIKTPNYSRREMTFGEFALYASIVGMFLIAIAVGIVNGFYDKKIERTERKIKSMEHFTEEDAERAENARKQPLNHVWEISEARARERFKNKHKSARIIYAVKTKMYE